MKYNYKTTECRKAYTRVPVYVSNMVHFSVHLSGLISYVETIDRKFYPYPCNLEDRRRVYPYSGALCRTQLEWVLGFAANLRLAPELTMTKTIILK